LEDAVMSDTTTTTNTPTDPDALLERAAKAGAEVILPIKDEDYGSRGFTVRDPEGNVWTFGTYRGA
jgi:uncharacterized glyoxalase superfamily protein PhnB